MEKIECFKIQLLSCKNIFDIADATPIKRMNCQPYKIIKEPVMIAADPFLFVKENRLYMFFEEKKLYSNGVIKMTYTEDLEHWSSPIIVLKEPFHLSYPWVFDYEGNVYMIPETAQAHSVRLYKASNEELTKFEYITTILDGSNNYAVGFCDTSIVNKDNVFYLFTTVNDGNCNILKLYYSQEMFAKFEEHPSSPISKSNKIARNGGGLFELNDKLYRVAQDCVYRYGDNVHLLEVEELTKCNYKEQMVREGCIDTKERFYKYGGHQFHYVKFKGKYIIATDAKEYHYFFMQKVMHKLGVYNDTRNIDRH